MLRKTVLLMAAAALAIAAFAQPAPQYTVKEDEPRTGSRIRVNAVRASRVPVNLSYHQLSPEDRARVHAEYEQMADGDEPPFPEKGLRSVYDPIGQAQARLAVEGELFLLATIGPDGKAREIKLVGTSPSADMTGVVARTLMRTTFKPALCGGQACTMDFPVRIVFRVE